MNRALLPEMLPCTDRTVLERQRACLKWNQDHLQQQQQQQQQEINYFFSLPSNQVQSFQGGLVVGGDHSVLSGEVVTRSVKPDPGFENGWPESTVDEVPTAGNDMGFGGTCGYANGSGFEFNYAAISRTASCPPAVAATEAVEAKAKESVLSEKMSSTMGRDQSSKKRKVNKVLNTKVAAEDDSKEKRIKGCEEEGDSKITEQNTNHKSSNNNNNKKKNSGDTSKENSKVSDVQKPDYIHVRARRGQATDSHSLAERVRREKISERMKYLQDLVPGCNKITGKAGMLDEIINYVQSLQRQVEFLSMKLAAVNPRLDFNMDNFFAKEVFPACTAANFPTIEMSSEMNNPAAFLQFNPMQQVVSCCGIEMGINPPADLGLRRTISAPVSLPNTFLDSSCFTQQIQPSSTWDAEFQNLYNDVAFDQGRSTSFPSQPFTGSIEATNNLKMEM